MNRDSGLMREASGREARPGPEGVSPGARSAIAQTPPHSHPHSDRQVSNLIELPFPAKILWPNGRGHHMAKHREFQKHKGWAYYAALAAGIDGVPFGPFTWSATFYPKTSHAIDDDNARSSLKAYQDGIARAMAVDDKLFPAPTIHFAEPVKGGRVVVSIVA